ncbi:MAG: radical SAM protein [Pseudomonadota bacterium]
MQTTNDLPRFTNLTLILTEQCNLGCEFCYVPKTGRTMGRDMAFRSVDFLVERAPLGAGLSLSFFGGEPFLARELLGGVIAYAKSRRPKGLTFSMPTNGTLLDERSHELVAESGMRLAVSIDSTCSAGEGKDHGLDRLRPNLPRLRNLSPMVRMTVTPENVGSLFENIAKLFSEGLTRIMHQPALEKPWPRSAVRVWKEQHQLIANWACERYKEQLPFSHLKTLEGIVSRLGGRAAKYCGAGVRNAAIDPDGNIYGCFRSPYGVGAKRLVMGNILGGPINETLVAAYSRLDPVRARPEEGSCKECEARDGCTVYCAAMGHVMCGDLRAVPKDACVLMQVQVEICRDIARRMRKLERVQRKKVGAHVAAAALAMSLAGGSVACGDDTIIVGDAGVSDAKGERVADMSPDLFDGAAKNDLIGPGLCPVELDGMIPGLCPPPRDTIPADTEPADTMIPGLCQPPQDGFPGPGVCPIGPDGMIPGIC